MRNLEHQTLMNKKCTNPDCPKCEPVMGNAMTNFYANFNPSAKNISPVSFSNLEVMMRDMINNSDFLANQLHIMQLKIDVLEYEKKMLQKLKK